MGVGVGVGAGVGVGVGAGAGAGVGATTRMAMVGECYCPTIIDGKLFFFSIRRTHRERVHLTLL